MNFIDDIIAKLGNAVNAALGKGGTGPLKITIGSRIAALEKGNEMFLSNGRAFFGQPFLRWKKARGQVSICPAFEPNPHIVISGMSGFGKSTLFKSMLSEIRNFGVACIIFDAHDEHSDMVRSMGGSVHEAIYSGINILELDGASVSERIAELTRLLKEVYSLGYIQATKLSECLWYTYRKKGARGRNDRHVAHAPTIKDLLDELSIFIGNAKTLGERNTLNHLKYRISLLNNSAFAGNSIGIGGLSNGLNSFSLGKMRSREAQLIYIGELLNRLYATMHDSPKNGRIRLYIMIDEAQFLVDESSNNSIIGRLIEEGRKYGVGVTIITHAASTLNRKIIANSATFITFFAREPAETSYVSRIISGGNNHAAESVRNRICTLGKGEAIMVSGTMRTPTVIRTRDFGWNAARKERSETEAAAFLAANARKPVERDSFRDMDDSLDALIHKGRVDSLHTRFNGREQHWLMWHNGSLSIEHEVWVAHLSSMLNSIGVKNRIIDNSNGPDILAYSNGSRIAIEYETGLKLISDTVEMIERRSRDYDSVIVIVNDLSLARYADALAETKAYVVGAGKADEYLIGGQLKNQSKPEGI